MRRGNGGSAWQRQDVELTERQRQVLRLIAGGKTNAEIGEALGISLDGAKWHVSEILSKLDVSTREEAAEWWRSREGSWSRIGRALRAVVPGAVWVKVGIIIAATGAATGIAVVVIGSLGHGTAKPSSSATTSPTPTLTASPIPTPFIDGRPALALDPRPAVQALARALPPVAEPTILSISETTYGEAMCGLTSYPILHPELPVWVVALDAIWNPFPYPVPPGVKPVPAYQAVYAYVLDRETGTSLQTFSPWPLRRDPNAGCSP